MRDDNLDLNELYNNQRNTSTKGSGYGEIDGVAAVTLDHFMNLVHMPYGAWQRQGKYKCAVNKQALPIRGLN